MNWSSVMRDILFGVAVGDALGVPFEFRNRGELERTPCTGMTGNGTHRQLPGTWSDDTSLTLILAENLADGYDLKALARNFVRWLQEDYRVARDHVFDVGITTQRSITLLGEGVPPTGAGDASEKANGNGSLMRILPLLYLVADKPAEERLRITGEVSSLTHRHPRSILGCFLYLEYARYILLGLDMHGAMRELRKDIPGIVGQHSALNGELEQYGRILDGNLTTLTTPEIKSSGYVVHTLEAALWCLMGNDSYAATVLAAVNLGHDTDTTAAVAGGLAGLVYGAGSIPEDWMGVLARSEEIGELAARFPGADTPPPPAESSGFSRSGA